jgi:hypothetical protein
MGKVIERLLPLEVVTEIKTALTHRAISFSRRFSTSSL